ncbi:MAG: heme exporter protein CcmB [Acidobacteria bacterium]|nr:heme exporter protein CcmB [Acidobacteriota bacterium]
MIRDAYVIAAKDLRIELRSRTALSQLAPFVVLVAVLFGFALNADRTVLTEAASGLYWITVLFAAVLAIGRSFSIEVDDSVIDMLRLSDLEPPSIFAGKAAALAVQLVAIQLILIAAVVILYDARIEDPLLFIAAAVAATVGVAAAGTLYGVLVAGLRMRETLLPILLLPVLAPVLISATRAFDDALGNAAVNGWSWCGLLAALAVFYGVFGGWAFGALMEESR